MVKTEVGVTRRMVAGGRRIAEGERVIESGLSVRFPAFVVCGMGHERRKVRVVRSSVVGMSMISQIEVVMRGSLWVIVETPQSLRRFRGENTLSVCGRLR